MVFSEFPFAYFYSILRYCTIFFFYYRCTEMMKSIDINVNVFYLASPREYCANHSSSKLCRQRYLVFDICSIQNFEN